MKKLILLTIFSAVLMLGIPWLTVEFAGVSGMAICFLLFYIVNPVFSAVCGIFAGTDIKRLWAVPVIVPVLFLMGVWIFFELGEPDFLIYGLSYLIIGATTTLLSYLLNRAK